MEEGIVLDKEAIRAVGSEMRVRILKSLLERQKTQSEISGELGISQPTVLEHMKKLEKSALVEVVPEYKEKKWKYYRLTRSGRALVEGKRASVILLLSHASALITAGLILIYILVPVLLNQITGTDLYQDPGYQPLPSQPSGTNGIAHGLTSLQFQSRAWLGMCITMFLILTILLYAIYFSTRPGGVFGPKEHR